MSPVVQYWLADWTSKPGRKSQEKLVMRPMALKSDFTTPNLIKTTRVASNILEGTLPLPPSINRTYKIGSFRRNSAPSQVSKQSSMSLEEYRHMVAGSDSRKTTHRIVLSEEAENWKTSALFALNAHRQFLPEGRAALAAFWIVTPRNDLGNGRKILEDVLQFTLHGMNDNAISRHEEEKIGVNDQALCRVYWLLCVASRLESRSIMAEFLDRHYGAMAGAAV